MIRVSGGLTGFSVLSASDEQVPLEDSVFMARSGGLLDVLRVSYERRNSFTRIWMLQNDPERVFKSHLAFAWQVFLGLHYGDMCRIRINAMLHTEKQMPVIV